jgi:hypothetical protein
MKRALVAGNPVEAQFVRAFLESAGIAATVRGEHLWGLRGGVPMTADTLPSVWVEDEDLGRAEQLLRQLEARARLQSVDPDDTAAATDAEAEWEAGEGTG